MKNNEAPILSPYRWVVLGVCMLAGFIGVAEHLKVREFEHPPVSHTWSLDICRC